MANNRMFLVHDATGRKVHIASHLANEWTVRSPDTLVERLDAAFLAEAGDVEAGRYGIGGTGWHVEYEHHSLHDEPLAMSTTETYQTADGKWHTGTRPTGTT
jgi:hypothetical protein